MIEFFQFKIFKNQPLFRHFITKRNGGVSQDELSSLNFGARVGDDVNNVKENYQRLLAALEIDRKQLIIPNQTHTDQVAVINGNQNPGLSNTDGLITSQRGVCIAVLVADCVPIILFDPVRLIAGVVHSGWRGTCSRILGGAIQMMKDEFSCNPEDILVGIGPSIGPEVYEVGPEVIEAFETAYQDSEQFINRMPGGKGLLDLWKANEIQALDSGIAKRNIEIAGICTYSNSDQFFSARKARPQHSGRFLAGAMIM